jgi:hypothetical protein
MSVTKTRIMYIENKSAGSDGPARIGRVTYSNSGRTLEYGGKQFVPFQGFKANYIETETRQEYWISGPKKRGGDRLYGVGKVEIDDDVRIDYWTEIRDEPESRQKKNYRDK